MGTERKPGGSTSVHGDHSQQQYGGLSFGDSMVTLLRLLCLPSCQSDLKWETQETLDIGIDARFLSDRLSMEFDCMRTTKDGFWPGAAFIRRRCRICHGGDVLNTGLELDLHWNDRSVVMTYGANLSLGYNKNEVKRSQ
jgi:hypothetical protein